MELLTRFTIRFRYLILSVVAVLTLFFGYFIKDVRVNSDVLGYLPDDDPAAMLFKKIGKTYGGNELILVGIETSDVFTYEVLDLVRRVTDSVRTVQGIGYVTSLTNVLDIKATDDGFEIGRLVDEYNIPSDPLSLAALKEYALSKNMYRRNLVSDDCSATLVVAKVLSGADRSKAVTDIRQKLANIAFDGNFYYGGMPVTLLELNNVILHDLTFIGPLTFVLISLVLALGFRSLRGVFIPMLTVVIAITWTMGLTALLGYKLTLITNVIPVVLMAVGSAYAIHVLNRINFEVAAGSADALKKAMVYITVPVFLASLTTVFGFLSFIAGSYLTMIQQFGVFASAGILFSLLLALFFIPALLSVLKTSHVEPTQRYQTGNVFVPLTSFIGSMLMQRRKTLLVSWLILLLASTWGISRIERRVDLVDYFRKDNPVQQSERLLKAKFNGSMPLYIHVKGNIQSPEALKLIESTQQFMRIFPYIPYSQSVADLIRQMNDAMGEGELVPDDPDKIRQLWFLLEGQEIMEQLVSYTLDEGVIQGYVATTDLETLREIEMNFGKYTRDNSNERYTLDVTGIPIMFKRLDDSIIRSQLYSLVLAILLVVSLVSLLQRSLVKGLLSIVPVAATLVVLFGVMGLTGIPLDIATVLTGSVTIGIGIDYAIHFITYFGNAFREGYSLSESITRTIEGSGRAILINLFSVSIGFASLLLSNLMPLQRFGFLIAVTMIVSGLAALTLLPLALLGTEKLMKRTFGKNMQQPEGEHQYMDY